MSMWLSGTSWERQVRVYGYLGVFIGTLAANMSIFLPLPGDIVLVAAPGIMGLKGAFDLSALAFVAALAAILGELAAYFAGRGGRAIPEGRSYALYRTVQTWMERYGGGAIFLFSITLLPFDLLAMVTGALKYPLWKFLAYGGVGRFVRALVIVYLGKTLWDLFPG